MRLLRFNIKGVVGDFLPSSRSVTKGIVVICPGAPSYSVKTELMEFLSKKGLFVCSMRYRGTWESEGKFLDKPLQVDVLDVISGLRRVTDVWSGKSFPVPKMPVYLLGSSFGALPVLFASTDPRIRLVVVLSGVADWTARSVESQSVFVSHLKLGFPGAYRYNATNMKKMFAGKWWNPVCNTDKIDGSKCVAVHNSGDKVCRLSPMRKLAKMTGMSLIVRKVSGHSSPLTKPRNFDKLYELLINP